MKILISGASGVLGTALTARLEEENHEVVRLVRRAATSPEEVSWDPSAGVLDPAAFDGVDVVVNLSGAGIGDKRWSEARRRVIVSSRIDTTGLLATTMAGLEAPPSLFVSQSAMGYYGDRGDDIMTEASDPGPSDDFSTKVVIDWEAAADPARKAGIRVIHPRTTIVLVPGVQFLGRLVPLFKMGLGGKIGDGTQWWSWIAQADWVRAMMLLIGSGLGGPVNLSAPNPVRNSEFTEVLGDVLGRPTVFTVPRFAIRTVMGREMADQIPLSSTRVIPERLLAEEFDFSYETIDEALVALLGSGPSTSTAT
jgi:uncharacterized protein (TIGR01777 family)